MCINNINVIIILGSAIALVADRDTVTIVFESSTQTVRVHSTPPKDKVCSQKRGNVANVRSSRQGAKKLQFLSGCNF